MYEIWEIRTRTSVIDLSFLLKTMANKFNWLRKKNECFFQRWDTSEYQYIIFNGIIRQGGMTNAEKYECYFRLSF
jgi:hypothetical protein